MEKIKFKDIYRDEKERLRQELSFKKFKKQLLKMDSSLNSFKERHL